MKRDSNILRTFYLHTLYIDCAIATSSFAVISLLSWAQRSRQTTFGHFGLRNEFIFQQNLSLENSSICSLNILKLYSYKYSYSVYQHSLKQLYQLQRIYQLQLRAESIRKAGTLSVIEGKIIQAMLNHHVMHCIFSSSGQWLEAHKLWPTLGYGRANSPLLGRYMWCKLRYLPVKKLYGVIKKRLLLVPL